MSSFIDPSIVSLNDSLLMNIRPLMSGLKAPRSELRRIRKHKIEIGLTEPSKEKDGLDSTIKSGTKNEGMQIMIKFLI